MTCVLRRWHVPWFNGSDSDDCTSRNVNHGKPQNCVELSPPGIGDNRSDDATEVNESGETVVKDRRRVIIEQKFSRKVKNKNG